MPRHRVREYHLVKRFEMATRQRRPTEATTLLRMSVAFDRYLKISEIERFTNEGINATQRAIGRLKLFGKGCQHHDGLLG